MLSLRRFLSLLVGLGQILTTVGKDSGRVRYGADAWFVSYLFKRLFMKKLYIGNLSYSTSENALAELFSKYDPEVSVKLIKDKFTGESRGFAFAEFKNDQAADQAMNETNGSSLDGKSLKVNEARPQEPRSGGFGGGSRGPRREGGRSFGNRGGRN